MALQDRPCTGMQVARTRVVGKPGPGPQHIIERRCRQHFDIRPARRETQKVGCDRLHGRLLQHDLREPHAIGIGDLACSRPPWQHAAMPVVPGEQRMRLGPFS